MFSCIACWEGWPTVIVWASICAGKRVPGAWTYTKHGGARNSCRFRGRRNTEEATTSDLAAATRRCRCLCYRINISGKDGGIIMYALNLRFIEYACWLGFDVHQGHLYFSCCATISQSLYPLMPHTERYS